MKDAKKVGDYVALVHFHKEVTVEIPVKVVAENAEELKAAEASVEAPAETPAEEVVEAPATEEEAPAEA